MSNAEGVESAMRSILPTGIELAAGWIGEVGLDVCSEEEACVRHSVASRRAEFLTGRTLARALLGRLGAPPGPLLPGPGRAPLWPQGIVGSLAHTGSLCVATVARASALRAIGVDLEPAEPLEPDLWPRICTGEEVAWLERLPERDRGVWARLFFSAKEAVYKLQHPLTGCFLEFHDVRVLPEAATLASGRFRACVPDPVSRALGVDCLSGGYFRGKGFLGAAAALEA